MTFLLANKCLFKKKLNTMTSTFSYQYYFIHYSFEENSDKNDPCGLQRKYVTNSSRDL